jgi:glycosyltransferase involved in cell wall biosynthesis
MNSQSALIVIPTTGAITLKQCVKSALMQDWPLVKVLVVIDGPQYQQAAHQQTDSLIDQSRLSVMTLPWNTGADGWYGHRIYASMGFLSDADWIFYLDQDNWYDADHVRTQIESCALNRWHWGHSLRKIHDVDGNYLMDDNCESLGKYPIFNTTDHHLVDTSSFCVSRAVSTTLGQAWYGQWGADRQFLANAAKFYPNWGGTGKYTLNYRLSGNSGSVTREFFEQGNQIMYDKYQGNWPWTQWKITI